MSNPTSLDDLIDGDNTMKDLSSMYEKVGSKMKMSNIRFDIDLYTLSDYVSLFLAMHMSQNPEFQTSYINTTRLKHSIENIELQKLPFLFFESDKLHNPNINLEGAMSAAGFSSTEKDLCKRKIQQILKMMIVVRD